MTLVNAWWHPGGPHGEEERQAVVLCNGCLPPRFQAGTAAHLARIGWDFEELEGDAHSCPWCVGRNPGRGLRRPSPPQEKPTLPNLLVIGVAKGGTSSLHRYLSLHPEIQMSEAKELNFFIDPGHLDKLQTYMTFFTGDKPVRGETSPGYTWHPLVPEIPDRIRATVPDAKMICLARDPVDRAISHYVYAHVGGTEFRPPAEAFQDVEDPYHPYVAGSRYGTQISHYMRLFPVDQLMVVDQADLLKDRRATLRRIFRFLGVDETFVSPGFEALANIGETQRRRTGMNKALGRTRLADAVRRLPPRAHHALFEPLRWVTTRTVDRPTVDQETRHRLRAALRRETEQLRELTGQEFASWQV